MGINQKTLAGYLACKMTNLKDAKEIDQNALSPAHKRESSDTPESKSGNSTSRTPVGCEIPPPPPHRIGDFSTFPARSPAPLP